MRPEQGLLKLRKELGLLPIFVRLRHILHYQEKSVEKEIVDGTDIQIYRELISGIYFGENLLTKTENMLMIFVNTTKTKLSDCTFSVSRCSKRRKN